MAASWRTKSARAFMFWHQLLVSWDQSAEGRGCYTSLTAHLKRFERKTANTFQFVIERGADPVYILHVLISLCDEEKVEKRVGLPQVTTVERCGTFPSDLRDFHLVTASDMQRIEASLLSYQNAGLRVDETQIETLRRNFDALPEPPPREGYTAEKAILHTDISVQTADPGPRRGRPGEHYFNTAMVLLARHLERTGPHPRTRYSSIAALLNAFCPATYGSQPLSRESGRQRVISVQDRVESYCQHFERWFEEWKRFLHRHPMSFNPWTG